MNEIAGPQLRSESRQPFSYTDRGALSEAWYRALYDSRARSSGGEAVVAHRTADGGFAPASRCPKIAPPAQAATRAPAAALSKVGRLHLRSVVFTMGRFRVDTSLRARPTVPAWRSAMARRSVYRAALRGGDRLDLLVQQHGDMLRLVAVYDGRSGRRVTDALRRAHAALLERGFRVELDARERSA